jgi:tetratricopeptide (TPR) repeat protein
MLRAAIFLALPISLALIMGGPALSDQNDPRLDDLFERLAAAQSTGEAAAVEEHIWALWLDTDERGVDESMGRGIVAMNSGNYAAALLAFDSIIATSPDFAEGWNKRATLHFLMGNFEGSIRDIDRTLALEPRHFGALSGLAMIREAKGQAFEALEALERLQHIHPQLPHLMERVARLTAQLGDPI